jgi:superkiller protein 3
VAVNLQPDCAVCWNRLGLALAGLESFEEAIAAYDRAIEENSSYLEPWNNRGISIVLGRGDYDGALESFEQALKIDPECMEAWVNKANVLKLAERASDADYARRKAQELGYKEDSA